MHGAKGTILSQFHTANDKYNIAACLAAKTQSVCLLNFHLALLQLSCGYCLHFCFCIRLYFVPALGPSQPYIKSDQNASVTEVIEAETFIWRQGLVELYIRSSIFRNVWHRSKVTYEKPQRLIELIILFPHHCKV